jgi:hypothetical protein
MFRSNSRISKRTKAKSGFSTSPRERPRAGRVRRQTQFAALTSGQPPFSSGRKASSPGTVAISFLVRRRHRSGDLRKGESGEQAKLPVNHSTCSSPHLANRCGNAGGRDPRLVADIVPERGIMEDLPLVLGLTGTVVFAPSGALAGCLRAAIVRPDAADRNAFDRSEQQLPIRGCRRFGSHA